MELKSYNLCFKILDALRGILAFFLKDIYKIQKNVMLLKLRDDFSHDIYHLSGKRFAEAILYCVHLKKIYIYL